MTGLAADGAALTEADWQYLLARIKAGECTPFLGAGINGGSPPLGGDIAEDWAARHEYPLRDTRDLPRVAQYLALTGPARVYPKDLMRALIESAPAPAFGPDHPLEILARLPLPVYVTTNFDDYQFRALRQFKPETRLELCGWNASLKDRTSAVYDDSIVAPPLADGRLDIASLKLVEFEKSKRKMRPTAAQPCVYHLHGHYRFVDSMVLTENDYLDFLVNLSRDPNLLPPPIKQALTGNALLFMGYSLADYNFRVLYRGMIHAMPELSRMKLSIQLPPTELNREAIGYLKRYFEDSDIRIYWGYAEDFARELWRRWKEAPHG